MRWRSLLYAAAVPWFLWSTMYPGGSYHPKDLVARPVKEFRNQAECERALPVYVVEVEKVYPSGPPPGLDCSKGCTYFPGPRVELVCSPVNPR